MGSRAKGTLSPARINEAYPHQVTIKVPWNGLGKRHTKEGDLIMCFADQSAAADFNVQFGGTLASLLL